MAASRSQLGLVDTDILIDAARGLPDAVQFLNGQNALGGVRISVISAMELVAGCRNAAELAIVRRFVQRTAVLELGQVSSETAYRLMDLFFLSHGLLIPDGLIAATALENGPPLYTRNVRHFQMIPALTVIRPY